MVSARHETEYNFTFVTALWHLSCNVVIICGIVVLQIICEPQRIAKCVQTFESQLESVCPPWSVLYHKGLVGLVVYGNEARRECVLIMEESPPGAAFILVARMLSMLGALPFKG